MEDLKIMEEIDAYLMGSLGEKEIVAFEAKISADPELRAEVELQKKILKGVVDFGNANLKNTLQQIHQDVIDTSTEKRIKPIWRRKMPVAAAIALLFALALWAIFPIGNKTSRLFNKYYEPYVLVLPDRSVIPSEGLRTAAADYQAGDYREAISVLESNPEGKEFAQLTLSLGISYLEIGQYDKAIIAFEEVLNSENTLYFGQALWYLALTQFKIGNIEKAKAGFTKLANDSNYDYHEEAKKILVDFE